MPHIIGSIKTNPVGNDKLIIKDSEDGNKLKQIEYSKLLAGTTAGDMLESVYDPNEVREDTFDMDNMTEGSTNLILIEEERAKLDYIGEPLPGVVGVAPVIYKISDTEIGIHPDIDIYIRDSDTTSTKFTTEAGSITGFDASGVGVWIIASITSEDVVFSTATKLSDTLNEVERAIPVGRMWLTDGVLTLAGTHRLVSNDDYSSREYGWITQSENISVSLGISAADSNYLSVIGGEIYRFLTIYNGSHIINTSDMSKIESMWGHDSSLPAWSVIDITGTDSDDILKITDYYDNGSGIIEIPPNQFTVHRIGIYAGSNELVFVRGQNVFGKIEDAVSAIPTLTYTLASWASASHQITYIGYFVCQKLARDYTDTTKCLVITDTNTSSISTSVWDAVPLGINYPTDNVGIGDDTPEYKLTVIGDVSASNSVIVGDITNNATVDSDGVTLNGSFSVWNDVQNALISSKLFSIAGSVDYNFTENTITMQPSGSIADPADTISLNIQMPHGAKLNSLLKLHLHYEQIAATEIEFTIEYRIQSSGGIKQETCTTVIVSNLSNNIFTYTSGTLNQIIQLADIQTTGGLSEQIQIKLCRTDVNAGNIEAVFLDGHYEIDTVGSKEEYVK